MCKYCEYKSASPFKRVKFDGHCKSYVSPLDREHNGDIDPDFDPKPRKATGRGVLQELSRPFVEGVIGAGGGASAYGEFQRNKQLRAAVNKIRKKQTDFMEMYPDSDMAQDIKRRQLFDQDYLDRLADEESLDDLQEYGSRTKKRDKLYEDLVYGHDKKAKGAKRRRIAHYESARQKKIGKYKKARKLFRPLGVAGALLGVGLSIYDLYNIVSDPQSETRRYFRGE